ncbi:hypothetical protein KEM56_002077 [Ascosphaera pollenicola]|nr:hypothetical protein KEM56_002077 [Ascosphaera pollenicola]
MASVDTSYLTSQVNQIVGELHGLFDDIGIPAHERDEREAELFSALSDTLQSHLHRVNEEKSDMIDEAAHIIQTIKQMEASLDDPDIKRHLFPDNNDNALQVTFPLSKCLANLQEKLRIISELHRQRFEEVKKLVQALESYSSHLEPAFVKLPLPPTDEDAVCPPDFDLSPNYIAALDAEFARVYEEYNERLSTVAVVGEDIVKLWAELGFPQEETDPTIVRYYRDSPEQLGLHESDIRTLRDKREKLVAEKQEREATLAVLKDEVKELWEKLGVEERDQHAFDAANRGCEMRVIHEYEEELARLDELKRQNLHVFVEDARCRLQELWDGLMFSEEEMLVFTPAFSDVYTDALLSAHEAEIARLQALKEERAPILSLIERHKSIIEDRETLAASSQDASRLMSRGLSGQKRDPTRLLREEKMRKRIAKELPKVEADLRKLLTQWEEETGYPFLVHGERYLDEVAAAPTTEKKSTIPPRSKTPSAPRPATAAGVRPTPSRLGHRSREDMNGSANIRSNAPSRLGAKTPTVGGGNGNAPGTAKKIPPATIGVASGRLSPSKIPTSKGAASPQRKLFSRPKFTSSTMSAATSSSVLAALRAENGGGNGMGGLRRGQSVRGRGMTTLGLTGTTPKPRAPPPKMRDLFNAPDPRETPKLSSTAYSFIGEDDDPVRPETSESMSFGSSAIRGNSPDDVYNTYDDRSGSQGSNSWLTEHVSNGSAFSSSSSLVGNGSGNGGAQQGYGHQRQRGSGGSADQSYAGGLPKSQNAIYANNGPPVLEKPNQNGNGHGNGNGYGYTYDKYQMPISNKTNMYPSRFGHQHTQSEDLRHDTSYHSSSFNTSSMSMMSGPIRHISNSSSVNTGSTSFSENWETYDNDDMSEPEADATDVYYAKLRATQKRFTGENGSPVKKTKGGMIRIAGNSKGDDGRSRGGSVDEGSQGHLSIAEEDGE